MKSLVLSLMMFSVFTLCAQPADGAWAAGDPVASVQSGAWTEASTWDCECVPSNSNDVAIQSGHTITLLEGDTARAESLAIAEGGTVALPTGARIELSAALSSLGDINGRGAVALVGEGPHVCGPAELQILSCGVGQVTLVDTLIIMEELNLEGAHLVAGGMLVLEGMSGIQNVSGTIEGEVVRSFDFVKISDFNHWISPGVEGALASQFLEAPGAVFVKRWDEPTTSYQELLGEDETPNGLGLNCSLPEGGYHFDVSGAAVLEATMNLTAESSSTFFNGWNMVGNPLTSFVDFSGVSTTVLPHVGATYQWVDSLQTYVVQVNGVGQFGHRGLFEPGAAFWILADTSFSASFDASCIVSRDEFLNQKESSAAELLQLSISDGVLTEECTVALGNGTEEYSSMEDAKFHVAFRGRNNLDLYSQSSDGEPLMVNSTSDSPGQEIPILVKGPVGLPLTMTASHLPASVCLTIEDIETGEYHVVDEDMAFTVTLSSPLDHHRFNLIVGGGVEATTSEVACATASDGTVTVMGPDPSSTFELLDAGGLSVGTFNPDSTGGTFTGLTAGIYSIIAHSAGCADLTRTVEVGIGSSGTALFEIEAQPDHIGCYDDHGGVVLEIEGGLAPYTVEWSHGATGTSIEVDNAGILDAIITDAAGCSDSTTVEVLAAPQVEAGIAVEQAVVTLIDGEAEVHFGNTSSGATAYQWNFGDGGSSIAESPIHAYTEAGAYTVGLNAWNDFCSDTYQMVVTVETVSSVGAVLAEIPAAITRNNGAWEVRHPEEAFTVEVFDLTGRMVHRTDGTPGIPAILDPAMLPPVALVHWVGATSGRQQTWRVAR